MVGLSNQSRKTALHDLGLPVKPRACAYTGTRKGQMSGTSGLQVFLWGPGGEEKTLWLQGQHSHPT